MLGELSFQESIAGAAQAETPVVVLKEDVFPVTAIISIVWTILLHEKISLKCKLFFF